MHAEDITVVKAAVRSFFEKRFQESEFQRYTLEGILFQSIDSHQNDILVGRF